MNGERTNSIGMPGLAIKVKGEMKENSLEMFRDGLITLLDEVYFNSLATAEQCANQILCLSLDSDMTLGDILIMWETGDLKIDTTDLDDDEELDDETESNDDNAY